MELPPIPQIVWGLVSFFVSFVMVRGMYGIFTVLLNLHDGFTKTVLTIGTFITVFAVIFVVPSNIIFNKKPSEE